MSEEELEIDEEEDDDEDEEEDEEDTPDTWMDHLQSWVFAILLVATSRLYVDYIGDLHWWQRTAFLASLWAIYAGVTSWWEQRSLPVEKRQSLRETAPNLALTSVIVGLLLTGVCWLFDRYQSTITVAIAALVIVALIGFAFSLRDDNKDQSPESN